MPLCVICGKQLANAAMAPAKLKRHLSASHSRLTNKGACYFIWLLESQNKRSKTFVKKVTFSEKAQEASYLAAELIA
jgi:hypothetical protein